MATNDRKGRPLPARARMPLAERAKIFTPFDPLKGFQEALRAKEDEVEARKAAELTGFDPAEATARERALDEALAVGEADRAPAKIQGAR